MHLIEFIKFIINVCITILVIVIIIIILSLGLLFWFSIDFCVTNFLLLIAQLIIIVIDAELEVFCDSGMRAHFRAIRFEYSLVNLYVLLPLLVFILR